MKKPILLFAYLFCWLTAPCSADEEAVQKYKNYTPEQIRDIPESERKSSVPIMYNRAASKGLSQVSKLLFAMELNSLMYPAVSDYNSAIKSFQKDLGEKPTGKLTVWQIHALEQRAEMQKLNRVLFPDQFSSYINENIAAVKGTATILDDKIAWPVNHVKVICNKTDGYCEYNQIILMFPNEDSWSQTYHIMEMEPAFYKISRWENGQIDAVVENNDTACRITSLNYNFKTKEFFEITRNTDKECKILDTEFAKLPKPRISQIVDGQEIIQEEFNKLQRRAYEFLSGTFRREIEAIITAE